MQVRLGPELSVRGAVRSGAADQAGGKVRRVHCSAETSGAATGDDAALGELDKTTALH